MSKGSAKTTDQSASNSKKRRVADRAFGNQYVSKIGRKAALITAVVILVGLALMVRQIGVVNPKSDLALNEVTESLLQNADGSCQWIVEFQLVNRSDLTVKIRSEVLYLRQANTARAQLPRGFDSSLAGVALNPGDTAPGRIVIEMSSCPASADQVKHDPLTVTYNDGSGRDGLSIIEF